MYTSEAALALVEDAMASGHFRGFLNLNSQAIVSLPALRDVTGGSADQICIEYDFMGIKRQQHLDLCVELTVKPGAQSVKLQVEESLYDTKADSAASTFVFNGQTYYLKELTQLVVLAQQLISAITSCADSRASLRKALLMIRHVSETTFLWGDCVVCGFEELAALVSAKLTYQVCAAAVANTHFNGLQRSTNENECRHRNHAWHSMYITLNNTHVQPAFASLTNVRLPLSKHSGKV